MAPRTVASFSADLSRFGQRLEGRLDELTRNVAFDLAEQVVDGTPVDTGNARAHWWASLGGPTGAPLAPAAVVERRDLTGAVAAGEMAPVLLDATAGDVVTLANNAAYIEILEAGGVNRVAHLMVTLAVANGPDTVDRIAREMTSRASSPGATRGGDA